MKARITKIRTLADVAAFIAANENLTKQQSAQMRSDINSFARVLGKSPATIIAEAPVIRSLRGKAQWKLVGLTESRWRNVISSVGRAMALAGVNVHRSRRNLPLDPDWEDLLALLPGERLHRDLTRFAGWCTALRVPPGKVSVEVFAIFLHYLQEECLQLQPRERWHVARRAWNRASEAVPGWPQLQVPVGKNERWSARPWTAFPAPLVKALEAYRAHVTTDNLFEDDHRAIKPISADNYIQRLKVYASMLIDNGEPIERFCNLDAFIDPDLVTQGLRLIVGNRTIPQASPATSSTCNALLSVARYLSADPEVIKLISKRADQLRYVRTGMTEKNKRRLTPLKDPKVKHRLLQLPQDIFAELHKVKQPTFKQALRFQLAVLLEVFINAPVRIKNAAELDIDAHIYRPPGGGYKDWRLAIPAGEVKNEMPIDFKLSPEAAALIDLYLKRFRPVISSEPGTALFPSGTGKQKTPSHLAKQFRRFIYRELGLEMNAHLMRHFVVYVFLTANPGQYEVARRLMVHKSIETTVRIYADFENEQALDVYTDMIHELRTEADNVEYL